MTSRGGSPWIEASFLLLLNKLFNGFHQHQVPSFGSSAPISWLRDAQDERLLMLSSRFIFMQYDFKQIRRIRNSRNPPAAYRGVGLGSTCDSLYHSRHRIEVGRRYLMSRKVHMICIQYIAIYTF